MVKRGQKGIISQKDRKVLLAPWEFKLHKVKYTKMAVVAVTSKNKRNASKYIKALGGNIGSRLVLPRDSGRPLEESLEGVGGLLLTDGPDIDPGEYGESPDPVAGLQVSRALDIMEMGLLRRALERDMPVLAICRGMQLLNVAFGGKLVQDIPGHREDSGGGRWAPVNHPIYLSPGSKLAAMLGTGGFFRVNSLHHQGLREAQKSPRLLASAYSLEDAVIEGLESPKYSWVVGVQFRPERQDEVPTVFKNLFRAFVERAEGYKWEAADS